MSWILVLISVLLAPEDAPSRECALCHRAQAELHASSRHAVAWINPLFRGEYDARPKTWCVSCHAPDVARGQPSGSSDPIAARGVSCQSCHIREGHMVSANRAPFSLHATRVVAEFGSAAECSVCHQFNFPLLGEAAGELLAYSDEPMQNTGAEAAAAGAECASCHDPHRAAGSHAPGVVAAAMSTTLCRDGGDLVMTITNSGAGHNLPTGGVHRFISARLWRSSAPARGVRMRLGREFGAGDGGTRRALVDTTIPVGQSRALRVAVSDLGGQPGDPVNADVRYHYALSDDAVLIDGSSAIKTIERERFSVTDLEPCETR